MRPYLIYIFIAFVFLSLIRTTLKIDRSERNNRLYEELCQVDKDYCDTSDSGIQ